jgi:endogenous inhibitor of DNA gyrase (YacG/DUF329 family)
VAAARARKVEPFARKGAACPLCGRPSAPKFRPFCSAACADRDLARWLGGDYRIPTEEAPEDDDEGKPET